MKIELKQSEKHKMNNESYLYSILLARQIQITSNLDNVICELNTSVSLQHTNIVEKQIAQVLKQT